MTELIITRGYPASGKTTLARQWVANEGERRARSNRDEIRASNFAAEGILSYATEQLITKIQQDQVRTLLQSGRSVMVDDMNLRLRYARVWADLAREEGVTFNVLNVTTPASQCVLWDEERRQRGDRHVGAEVICNLATRFPLGRWPEVMPSTEPARPRWEPYEPIPCLPAAYLVDLDGTCAKKRQGPDERGWHDYARVGEDMPNPWVLRMVAALAHGADIVFMSGRKEFCREATLDWLEEYLGPWAANDCPLFMRADGDNRSDDIVKYELFNEHVRERFNVLGVLDDRDRVVAMWRAIGLGVAQVDYGKF